MGERGDLDGQADDFRYHLERAEPGSGLEECARWGLALVAELRVAREVAAALAVLVDHFADQEALAGSPLLRARQARAAYDQAGTP